MVQVTLRKCTECLVLKPTYVYRGNGSGGFSKRCMDCTREERNAYQRKIYAEQGANSRQNRWRRENPEKNLIHRLRTKAKEYGLEPDTIETYYLQHNGKCDICGQEPSERSRSGGPRKRLSIDHNHATGEFRGLLCQPCNKALGNFKDDPALLGKAIQYLKKGSGYHFGDTV